MDIPLRPLTTKPSQPAGRIRDILTTVGIDRPTPEFKQALSLLQVRDLDSLENHFLALEAFLKPWSHYRDTFLLVRPPSPTEGTTSPQPQQVQPQIEDGAAPAAAATATADTETNVVIDKADIVWFYSHFLHGELRYDARADHNSDSFTYDETQYGKYEKSHWGQAEHEKLMYAWLLQEFGVGRSRNRYGFRYFELQNICTVWELVFQPIVTAVRDSYDIKGRKFYGRLANFIEERSPSRLAFPRGNVSGELPGYRNTAIPLRMMSFTKKGQRMSGAAQKLTPIKGTPSRGRSYVSKSELDEIDRELKEVEEKYGGVVERPKFKKNLKEWLTVQKERAKQRHAMLTQAGGEDDRESVFFGCKGLGTPDTPSKRSIVRQTVPFDRPRVNTVSDSDESSKEKDTAKDKLKRLVPFGMYGWKDASADEPSPKSPDHGVTRFVEFGPLHKSDDDEPTSPDLEKKKQKEQEEDQPWTKPVPPFTKPVFERKSSDGVYTAIRNSNPFQGEKKTSSQKPLVLEEDTDDMSVYSVQDPATYSIMGPPSAIPEPLFKKPVPVPVDQYTPERERRPSYEGTAYDQDISPSFVAQKLYDASHLSRAPRSQPLEPLSSYHQLKWAPPTSTGSIPERVPWPGAGSSTGAGSSIHSISSRTRSARFDDSQGPHDCNTSPEGSAPPIPVKSPRRAESLRVNNTYHPSSLSPPLARMPESPSLGRSFTIHHGGGGGTPTKSTTYRFQPFTEGERIVSRENIRARLALSRQSFESNDNVITGSSESLRLMATAASAPGKTKRSTTPMVKESGSPLPRSRSRIAPARPPQTVSGGSSYDDIRMQLDSGTEEEEGSEPVSPATSTSPRLSTFNKHHFPRKNLGPTGSPNVSPEYF